MKTRHFKNRIRALPRYEGPGDRFNNRVTAQDDRRFHFRESESLRKNGAGAFRDFGYGIVFGPSSWFGRNG